MGRNIERKQRMAVILLCPLLSAAVVLPFFFMGKPEGGRRWWSNQPSVRTVGEHRSLLRVPDTHDMYLHSWQMEAFYRGLQAGEIYPRWEEDTNRGFGAPTTSYYPPGVYYLTSALFVLVRDWDRVLACCYLLMMIASGTAFYFYARRFLSRWASVIAMSAYILLPYHLIDQYQRGALAELLGFVWMPLILFFADRLLTPGRELDNKALAAAKEAGSRGRPRRALQHIPDIVGLAVCYGAFIWSHVPTAYQLTLVGGASLCILALVRKNYKGLLLICIAVAIGLGLSGAYLYPASVEQSLIHFDRVDEIYKSFVFSLEDQGLEALHEFNGLIEAAWIIGVAAMLLCGLTLLRTARVRNRRRQTAIFWLGLGGLAAFMMTPASIPLGSVIPKIETGVYSWRMLSIVTMVAALCAGVCAEEAFGTTGSLQAPRSRLAAVAAMLILSSGAAFSITQVMMPMAAFETFEPPSEHLSDIIMPHNIRSLAQDLPTVPERAELLGQKGEISILRWEPQHRELRTVLGDNDRVVVRTFNFPGWTAKLDGQQVGIEDFGSVAAIMLEIPAGSHTVTLDFLDTEARRIGKALSIASLLILLVMMAIRSVGLLYLDRRR